MSDIDNLKYQTAVEPISDNYGLLISKDYGYRLLPSKVEISWACGVYNSGNYDKAYQIALQGMSSVRLNLKLSFNLDYQEYIKASREIVNNVTEQSVLAPMSYIDPSGVLKEILLYHDSIATGKQNGSRFEWQISAVTDTASAINYWRNSFFVNAVTLEDGDQDYLERWDIVYNDKKFYYMNQDVSSEEVNSSFGGSIVDAAMQYGEINRFFFNPDLPLTFSTQPDFANNDFPGSYPIRMKKGDFSYDYQGLAFEYASIPKKQLICMLHFLEHQYGYRNFKLTEIGIQQDLIDSKWNTQEWSHSHVAGDYHTASVALNQNHLPNTF